MLDGRARVVISIQEPLHTNPISLAYELVALATTFSRSIGSERTQAFLASLE